VLAIARELAVEVLGRNGRSPAKLDDVDRRPGDLDHAVDLGDRQPLVQDVRDPVLSRLRRAIGQIEQVAHHVAHGRG
jgi:hypothetical protein